VLRERKFRDHTQVACAKTGPKFEHCRLHGCVTAFNRLIASARDSDVPAPPVCWITFPDNVPGPLQAVDQGVMAPEVRPVARATLGRSLAAQVDRSRHSRSVV